MEMWNNMTKDEKDIGKEITKLLMSDNYQECINLIRKELKRQKDDHWLYASLSSAYYGMGKYKRALKAAEKALNLEMDCPLSQWYYATSLERIGNQDEALDVYKHLLDRCVRNVAFGTCGEGLSRAKSLLNDCRFRIGSIYMSKQDLKSAKKWFKLYIRKRKEGVRSIFRLKTILAELKKCENTK